MLQGFNAALTEPVSALGRRGGQIREMELKLHPELKEPLRKLCDDPKTTVVVLSGSDRSVLDDVPYFFVYKFCTFFFPYCYAFGLTTSYAELW